MTQPAAQSPAAARFATLDAMRGVAALCVLLFHANIALLPMRGGYLAVDLFFGLSGFVLARVYLPRLRAGMTWGDFVRRRVTRLYPMSAVGAALGIILFGGNPNTLLLIPDIMSPLDLYPTNPALWSLLFELLVSLAWAAVAVRVGRRSLAVALVISGAVLFGGIAVLGSATLIGPFWFSAPIGLVRTIFSFVFGLVLAKGSPEKPRSTALAWLPLAALPLLLVSVPQASASWEIASMALLLPGLSWLGARWQLPAPRLATRLGDLSYPLYCIHVPVLAAVGGATAATLAATVALVVAALMLDRWVDRPARAAIGRRLLRGTPYTRIGIST